jgi:hypothetical protein
MATATLASTPSTAAGQHPSDRVGRVTVGLFTSTVFFGSTLLFLLEPMFTKMILPTFGGSPAVWNTAMVFFQTALFLAYIYSHKIANRSARQSVAIHSIAVWLPFLVLPLAIRGTADVSLIVGHPAFAVLKIAVLSIGLPFFIVATSAPLLQRWFSETAHPNASDPYFLYAASNAGSLIGLALYPCILEPGFGIHQQVVLWSTGYVVFTLLTLACGVARYKWQSPVRAVSDIEDRESLPTLREKATWVALAFVPASLLYAFTAQLSTDFPPIPLLWIIPLGLYLLTFIVAFSKPSALTNRCGRLLPVALVASMLIFLLGFKVRPGEWAVMGLIKLVCFVVIALAFHAELARRRPGRHHLTEYYLWVSTGGIFGGLLNAFIAPVVFSTFWEYPLTLLIAAALLPVISTVRRRIVNWKLLIGSIAVVCVVGIAMQLAGPAAAPGKKFVLLALGAVLCVRVPAKWMAAALLLVSVCIGRIQPPPLYQARSFFGVYQVTTAAGGKWHILSHGTTMHGLQRVADSPLEMTPRGYYMPVKGVLDRMLANKPDARIGAVGLGAGIVGCYATPGQSVTFFEIDPLVKKLAGSYFTFLSQCPAHKEFVLGDARLTMRDAAPQSFDVIVLDAFSSDAVPLHLLTREAFAMYREKLTPGGIILAHVSNNYLELPPVIAGSGAHPGYSTLVLDDSQVTADESSKGRLPSRWVASVPLDDVAAFESIQWKPFDKQPVTWTDDHSSVVAVLPWSRFLPANLGKFVAR